MKNDYFQIFMVFWLTLGLVSFLFFHFNRNVKVKKIIFPVFVVIVGIIFGSFVGFMSDFSPQTLLFMIPAVVVITILNIRNTQFCNNCGKTNYSKSAYSKPKFCSSCGANL